MVNVNKVLLITFAVLLVSISVFGDDQIPDDNNVRLRREIQKNPIKFKSPLASNRYTVSTTEYVAPHVEGGHASKLYREYKLGLQEERLKNVNNRVEGAGGMDGVHHYGEYHVHKHGHKGYKDDGIYTDSSRDPYDKNRAGPREYVDPQYYANVDSINHDPYYNGKDEYAYIGKPSQPVTAAEAVFWNGYYDVADRGVLNTMRDFFVPNAGGKGRAPYWETGGTGSRRN